MIISDELAYLLGWRQDGQTLTSPQGKDFDMSWYELKEVLPTVDTVVESLGEKYVDYRLILFKVCLPEFAFLKDWRQAFDESLRVATDGQQDQALCKLLKKEW